MIACPFAGQINHGRIVRRNRRAPPVGQQHLQHPCIGRIDLRLLLIRDRSRFAVRALDESDARPERIHPLQIELAAPQRRLQHDANLARAVLPERLEDVDRRFRVRRALHVDSHEEAGGFGAFEDPSQVVDSGGGVDVQPELRQFERDVPFDAGVHDGVEQVEVLPRGYGGAVEAGDAFAEQIQRVAQVASFERPRRLDRFLDGLPRNEAAGEAPRPAHAVSRRGLFENGALCEEVEKGPGRAIEHQ